MSGIIKTGTSVQKGVQLVATVAKVWQHNRGVKPLRVDVINAASGSPVAPADLTVLLPDLNSISVKSTAGVASVNIFVDWDVTSPNANSIAGLPGAVAPSNGFV